MKSFREYLEETELMETEPSVGDVFELEIAREEIMLETTVVDVVEDGIVIEADEKMMSILRHVGYLEEDSNMPPARDSISPIHGGQDSRKFNTQHSTDNDLEEQQGMSQRAQSAFLDLDAIERGEQPATATIQDLEQGRERVRQGHTGKPISRSSLSDLDKFELDRKFLKVAPGTSFNDWQKLQGQGAKPTNEAKYQGREVPLGKPMAGDVKKSKVYVRGPKGNVVKVNFGDPNMKIKKSNPASRKSFRERHNCDIPGPRWKARYWSCRAW